MLLTIIDSFLIANAMLFAITYIVLGVEFHLYIYCRKAFGEHCNIKIAIDYEMKLEINFKGENYKMKKNLAQSGIRTHSSRFLDWRCNVLHWWGSYFIHLKVNDLHINIDTR